MYKSGSQEPVRFLLVTVNTIGIKDQLMVQLLVVKGCQGNQYRNDHQDYCVAHA